PNPLPTHLNPHRQWCFLRGHSTTTRHKLQTCRYSLRGHLSASFPTAAEPVEAPASPLCGTNPLPAYIDSALAAPSPPSIVRTDHCGWPSVSAPQPLVPD